MRKHTKKQKTAMILLHESYWRDSLNPYPGRLVRVWVPAKRKKIHVTFDTADDDSDGTNTPVKFDTLADRIEQDILQHYAEKVEYFADIVQKATDDRI